MFDFWVKRHDKMGVVWYAISVAVTAKCMKCIVWCWAMKDISTYLLISKNGGTQ